MFTNTGIAIIIFCTVLLGLIISMLRSPQRTRAETDEEFELRCKRVEKKRNNPNYIPFSYEPDGYPYPRRGLIVYT